MTHLKSNANPRIYLIAVYVIFIFTSCNSDVKTELNTSDSTVLIPDSAPDTATASPNPTTSTSTPATEEEPVSSHATSSVIESNIDGTFDGFDSDKIFKLTNGQIWQQDEYKYSYSYKYRPSVTIIYSSGYYKMLVDGMSDPIRVKLLNSRVGKNKNTQSTSDVIEAYITSDFNGFSSGNIYKLDNGQVWEQTEPYIYLYIYIRPKVTIYRTGGTYKLKFDNIDHAVTVRQVG